MIQRAYPMLPAALSETLCSLTPDEDKLAFSVVFTMSPEGNILSTWIGKTVIRFVLFRGRESAKRATGHAPN